MGDSSKALSCRSQYASSNMVLQVQEETWLDYQDIQGMILCERGCIEETVSWTLELILYSSTVGHSEVDVDFAVYSRFAE